MRNVNLNFIFQFLVNDSSESKVQINKLYDIIVHLYKE